MRALNPSREGIVYATTATATRVEAVARAPVLLRHMMLRHQGSQVGVARGVLAGKPPQTLSLEK